MPTYGALRLRLSQLAPGIALEMIDGWIQDRYTQILDDLPWKRLEGESILQAPPSYTTGTVTATQGSANITGVGTAWTAAMSGFMIRINNGSEYYQFSYTSATAATLDRPFEQETAGITAATVGNGGAGYQVGDLFQVTGGTPTFAQGQVTAASSGVVTAFNILVGGASYGPATGVATITSTGVGSGLTVNITTVGASTGLSYRVDQNVFLVPCNTRIIRQIRPFHDVDHPLQLVTTAELNRMDAQRNQYGTPYFAAATWDSGGTSPQLQLELYPVPQCPTSDGSLLSWVVDYIGEQGALDPNQTSVGLLPWTRPACIIAGVEANIAKWQKDYTKYALEEARFEKLLMQMKTINNLQRGPAEMRLARELRRGPADRDRQNELRSLLGPGAWRDGWSG